MESHKTQTVSQSHLPVLQVAEVVDEGGLLEVTALCQEVEVVWVPQALNELQLSLEPDSLPLLHL